MSGNMWFSVITLVVAFIILIVVSVDVYYFNQVRTSKSISSTTAAVLMGVNLLAAILILLILIWAIVNIANGSVRKSPFSD